MAHTEDVAPILMATVYLKTSSGRSLLNEKSAAPGDPTPYLPSPDTVRRAAAELERLGFKIEAQGATLSISGPPDLFEQAFGVKIAHENQPPAEQGTASSHGQPGPKSSQPVMLAESLKDTVEGIVLATPGVPFSGI